jgi:hypothetical protein
MDGTDDEQILEVLRNNGNRFYEREGRPNKKAKLFKDGLNGVLF